MFGILADTDYMHIFLITPAFGVSRDFIYELFPLPLYYI